MAYCRNCGSVIDDRAVICPKCGVPQKTMPTVTLTDKGGFGWGALGFCLPLLGLILYLVWLDTKPKTSRAAGLGALISAAVTVSIVIIYLLFFGVLFAGLVVGALG